MASVVTALSHYRPQIEYGETAGWREIADYLVENSTLSRADIIATLTGLQEAVLHFHRHGRGVKLEGLGTYLPNVNYRGEYDVAHRLNRELKRALNDGSFAGKIRNRRNIGKTQAEIIALWNSEHPDDPVE